MVEKFIDNSKGAIDAKYSNGYHLKGKILVTATPATTRYSVRSKPSRAITFETSMPFQ